MYKCPNCKQNEVKKAYLLCDDCKKAARKLDQRVSGTIDKEILTALETKPRSWRDMFRAAR